MCSGTLVRLEIIRDFPSYKYRYQGRLSGAREHNIPCVDVERHEAIHAQVVTFLNSFENYE
jgi:hypothetical protein